VYNARVAVSNTMSAMNAMRASEIAYERLREDIIQWRLEPGAALGEVELAARLGVSRTPIREALLRLTAEGLVSADGGRSATVSAVSMDHIRDLYELREALETQAARLAARRRDVSVFEALKADFLHWIATADHPDGSPDGKKKTYSVGSQLDAAIDEAAGSVYLINALRELRGPLERIRHYAHGSPGRLSQATAEHLLITEAIIDRDETLAAQATGVHLHNSLTNILGSLPAGA
jgi:GntR family transcriptional regulator, rspAB operon transcriptional repressor